uniref:Uncharacterized protein n=1 Tax=Glossina palpalis gambiensis TaxID=67801 RepID=A0A1B0B2T5_9MUSC
MQCIGIQEQKGANRITLLTSKGSLKVKSLKPCFFRSKQSVRWTICTRNYQKLNNFPIFTSKKPYFLKYLIITIATKPSKTSLSLTAIALEKYHSNISPRETDKQMYQRIKKDFSSDLGMSRTLGRSLLCFNQLKIISKQKEKLYYFALTAWLNRFKAT